MDNKNFIDYLFTKMEETGDNTSTFVAVDELSIGVASPDEKFNLNITCKGNMLSYTFTGYPFMEKHRKAIVALINTYNEGECTKLHVKFDRLMAFDIVECATDEAKIKVIEDAFNFFTGKNEITNAINEIFSGAKERRRIIANRVDLLKSRAADYESNGDYQKAKRCFYEICQYYGYGHMEIIALEYGKSSKTKNRKFPVNLERQLELQMVAVEKDKDNVFAPVLAYQKAKALKKDDLCERIIALGQERGSWDVIAFLSENPNEILERIANCYRNGIGCERNEQHAIFYDRLIAGERQEVFKDMLTNGFAPVFKLMNSVDYYKFTKLDELNGISDEFKQKFLYGDSDKDFRLPNWFVPLVNDLEAEDRDVVLETAKRHLEERMSAFISSIKSGNIEIVDELELEEGMTVECDGKLKCVFLPELEGLAECETAKALCDMIAEFSRKLGGM